MFCKRIFFCIQNQVNVVVFVVPVAILIIWKLGVYIRSSMLLCRRKHSLIISDIAFSHGYVQPLIIQYRNGGNFAFLFNKSKYQAFIRLYHFRCRFIPEDQGILIVYPQPKILEITVECTTFS